MGATDSSDRRSADGAPFDVPSVGVSADAGASIAVSRFDAAYTAGRPPWDIDGPQPAFRGLVDRDAVSGTVLDIGCGTGEHALFFASRGIDVLGVDVSPVAIARARPRGRPGVWRRGSP
jgi:SAM-dependent methyltransferase